MFASLFFRDNIYVDCDKITNTYFYLQSGGKPKYTFLITVNVILMKR